MDMINWNRKTILCEFRTYTKGQLILSFVILERRMQFLVGFRNEIPFLVNHFIKTLNECQKGNFGYLPGGVCCCGTFMATCSSTCSTLSLSKSCFWLLKQLPIVNKTLFTIIPIEKKAFLAIIYTHKHKQKHSLSN